jgi:hypothetical protein
MREFIIYSIKDMPIGLIPLGLREYFKNSMTGRRNKTALRYEIWTACHFKSNRDTK